MPHPARVSSVAASPTLRAGDGHVRQELHVQVDNPRSVAHGTAQFSGVIGEVPSLEAQTFRVGGAGRRFSAARHGCPRKSPP